MTKAETLRKIADDWKADASLLDKEAVAKELKGFIGEKAAISFMVNVLKEDQAMVKALVNWEEGRTTAAGGHIEEPQKIPAAIVTRRDPDQVRGEVEARVAKHRATIDASLPPEVLEERKRRQSIVDGLRRSEDVIDHVLALAIEKNGQVDSWAADDEATMRAIFETLEGREKSEWESGTMEENFRFYLSVFTEERAGEPSFLAEVMAK